jgi:hypothetical protein
MGQDCAAGEGEPVVCFFEPVVYFFTGGEKAKRSLDELKAWLGANNAAVTTVLLLVFGVVLISKFEEDLEPTAGGSSSGKVA